jgi:hypothetical protein
MAEEVKIGRPRNPRTAQEVWEKEVFETVVMAKKVREFAEGELEKLIEEAKTIGGIKNRMDILKMAVELNGQLTKNAKAVMSELQKEPPKDEEAAMDVEKFLEGLKR